ncbi:myosin-9 [Asbolus verrucosus]|uniref:Myosin-9 n=1 Tax=Asbolus verrucosus TaxID=1661398 RepID=A0A482VK27_ASBVE|nr:myosin-9 [Asbolus verrucosus]
MNTTNNALSAKNVKIHGMSSTKWTTKDKITQYKGLVNLYKRDREIIKIDTAVATKRQYKGLINLRNTIEADRHELNNAIGGDRQKLRNTLAEHRELQLAYQNSDPKKVIENVHQLNFTKRKELDKLLYQMKLKSEQLMDLKLEEALLQDRMKYEIFDKLKEEKQAQIITGKVQDALLKKEAALAIQQTYGQIINVMKKDALYFDGILQTIQSDYWYQCRCILNAAKQGQLTTEYKNDREQEFATLKKAIVQDMRIQKLDLDMVREQAENLQSNLKHLLRKDSDLTTCIIKVEETQDFEELYKDLAKIETILKYLRNTTLVSTFELIYPNLQEQLQQKKRLTALAKKCERNRDIIMNKLNHAELMSNLLKNTMVETTGEYKKRKKELLEQINAEMEKKRQCDASRNYKQKLIAEVRISLRQLQQLCKPIKTPEERQQEARERKQRGTTLVFEDTVIPPEEDETDGTELCNICFRMLIPKFTSIKTFLRLGWKDP